MDNNEALKLIMRRRGLSAKEIAELLGMKVEGVYNWTRSPDTSGYRKMPEPAMKLLVMTLQP